MKKTAVLLASLMIQACLGGLYAWSVFVPSLKNDYGLSSAQAQIIFGVTIAVFTIAMIFAGRFQNKYGPRLIAGIGGVFFGSGYVYASLSQGDFLHLLTGIGILSGIGIGMGYVCPLATCIKWFPHNKGLVTGVSVASFGCGAALLSMVVNHHLSQGMDVLMVFRWISIFYTILIIGGAIFLAVPEKILTQNQKIQKTNIFRESPFWMLFVGMLCGTFSGLLVIGNLKPIGLDFGIQPIFAAMAISAFAIGNGAGRIFWGWVLDKAGKMTMPFSLLALSMSVFAIVFISGINAAFVAIAFLIGFGFGACFVVYAAYVGTLYGSESVGTIYPWVFLAYGISGIVGPTVGGLLYEKSGSYLSSIVVAAAMACIGAIVLWIYYRRENKICKEMN